MRLPNGYGSVTKLSGARRRPYIVRITTGWEDNGKRKVSILGYYAKRSEALAALADYNTNPYDPAVKTITFAELHEKWVESRYTDMEEPNQYKAAYKRCAMIWEMPFGDIKTAQFQKVINDCELGYSTKKNIRILCNLMAKYAMANDIIIKNYVSLTELPPEEDSRLHVPFTPKEIESLWANASDTRVQIVLIYIYTGMRATELCKVALDDIHLDEHYLEGGKKTRAGKNRKVPIATKIEDFVRDAVARSNGQTLLCDEKGRTLNYDKMIAAYWNPVMQMLRMDHLPHDARHTCATMMDNKDVDAKTKKLILGHASKDVTERVYTHKTMQQLIEAINRI